MDRNATCIINFLYEGQERKANAKPITGAFENMFHVTMDDGYENTFFTTIEQPYTWYEESIGYTELAQAVGRAIEQTFLQ
ncbi:MAG: hypothetical protein ICV84_00875 [Flavisolibacter sp.]|nr:hypothetical protein [Flavisolibacter sp.]